VPWNWNYDQRVSSEPAARAVAGTAAVSAATRALLVSASQREGRVTH